METVIPTGANAPRTQFGPWQGLWLVIGYVVAAFVGSVLVGLVWGIGIGIKAGVHGAVPGIPKPGIDVVAWSALVGVLLATVWGVGFSLHNARPLLKADGPWGFAWRRPAYQGYFAAVGLAIVLVAVVWGLEQLVPPDAAKLTGPMEQLSRSHGWPHLVFILLALVIAPPVEEFVFRGALFASFARRFGVIVATILTTLVFALFHAADKIHYWPGFVDVALLSLAAIFLRLRYRSLWPAIGLHFLYNAVLIFLL